MLPDHVRRYAQRIGQHEMGHYVMSRLLGFRTGAVELEIFGVQGHRGGAEIFPAQTTSDIDSVDDYICRRVIVLYAGVMAETLQNNLRTEQVDTQAAVKILNDPNSGAKDDFSKVRELIQLLRNIRYDYLDEEANNEQLACLNSVLWDTTANLVNEHRILICSLASMMAQKLNKLNEPVKISAGDMEKLPALVELKPALPIWRISNS